MQHCGRVVGVSKSAVLVANIITSIYFLMSVRIPNPNMKWKMSALSTNREGWNGFSNREIRLFTQQPGFFFPISNRKWWEIEQKPSQFNLNMENFGLHTLSLSILIRICEYVCVHVYCGDFVLGSILIYSAWANSI